MRLEKEASTTHSSSSGTRYPRPGSQLSCWEHHTYTPPPSFTPAPSLAPAPHNPLVSRQRHKRKVERALEARAELAVTQSNLVPGGGGSAVREGWGEERTGLGKVAAAPRALASLGVSEKAITEKSEPRGRHTGVPGEKGTLRWLPGN